jgi:hypothetical protein
MKGSKMRVSESLLAEVKSLIAIRLGLDEKSIDVRVTVSVRENDAATGRTTRSHSVSEGRSWSYTESTSTTKTEDK